MHKNQNHMWLDIWMWQDSLVPDELFEVEMMCSFQSAFLFDFLTSLNFYCNLTDYLWVMDKSGHILVSQLSTENFFIVERTNLVAFV